MAHEICETLAAHGLPLSEPLRAMFDDHYSHCSERRGCGLTQATRHLAQRINRPRHPTDPTDLDIFEGWPMRDTSLVAHAACLMGWTRGWRNLDQAPAEVLHELESHAALPALARLTAVLKATDELLALEESRCAMGLIKGIVTGESDPNVPKILGLPFKPEIGSCSQAEEYFLEMAHGRIRRGGQVNTVIDTHGEPVLLEKINLGESHSAISLRPLLLFDVCAPPGSLIALQHTSAQAVKHRTRSGHAIRLAAVRGRFMRITTLAVSPANRSRAFTHQVHAQLRKSMLSPLHTTLASLQAFAQEELGCLTT